jgi:hypothetical protein
MIKHIGKGFLLIALALVMTLGPGHPAWAKNAKAESFAQPDQTMEYHFMLSEGDLTEKDIAKFLAEKIIAPLKPICDIEPLSTPKNGIYVDSSDRILEKNKIILRVREGLITTKARALAPEVLLDMEKCSAKKYEMDYFGQSEYSISSDIKFKKEAPPRVLPFSLLRAGSAEDISGIPRNRLTGIPAHPTAGRCPSWPEGGRG